MVQCKILTLLWNLMKAKFISIEGIEGVGKSTAIELLCQRLQAAHIEYVLTREPGGTSLGEQIRELLLENRDEPMMPLTEALLFYAGREQNITQIIEPALAAGKFVISDRFTDSSLAYQGGGRGVPEAYLQALTQWVQRDMAPDVTLLLDAPVEVGLARIADRKKDRIEDEQAAFFERIRATYLKLAQAEPNRYRIIQANQSLDKVKQDISAVIDTLIR